MSILILGIKIHCNAIFLTGTKPTQVFVSQQHDDMPEKKLKKHVVVLSKHPQV